MNRILYVVALVLFLIAGLISAGVVSGAEAHTLAYFGLAALAAAPLVP
jgi:hypothetical protein